MRFKLTLILMLIGASGCYAQRLSVSTYRLVKGDTTQPQRKVNHYIGIQANKLLNQLLNLGGNSPVVTNPYFISYSFNSISTGWGMSTGIGYTNETIDSSDPVTQRTSTLDDFSIRIGVEKKSFISKRWLGSWGFDLLWSKNGDKTHSSFQQQFNGSSTDVISSDTYAGFGPRVALNFLITERIILGTEASYYYKAKSNSQKITNTSSSTFIDPVTQQPHTTTSSSSNGTSQRQSDFSFAAPVVVYLFVKF